MARILLVVGCILLVEVLGALPAVFTADQTRAEPTVTVLGATGAQFSGDSVDVQLEFTDWRTRRPARPPKKSPGEPV